MRVMKKVLSLCVVLATVLASFAFVLPVNAWEENPDLVDIRFGVVNDSHVTFGGGDAVDRLRAAVDAFQEIGCVDGLALVGDVIYYNSKDSDPTDIRPYDHVYNTFAAAGYEKEDVIAYAMGNHEFPQSNLDAEISATSIETFENYTGFDMDHHTVKNGFHFIAGGAINYNGTYSAETQDWLMAEIDKAIAEDATNDVDGAFADGVIPNSQKPVFLLLHHPLDGTIFNVTGDKFTDEFIAFLKTRPQVINLTAHWHVSAYLPQTIWQDGFTQYQGAMIGGGYLEEYEAVSTGNINAYSQGAYVDVLDNVVKIHRMDFTNGYEIGQPYEIDIPAIVADKLDDNANNDNDHFLYTADKRAKVESVAAFPEGAELTTEVEGATLKYSYPNNAVMLSYDEIQQDDFVRGYRVEVVNKNSGKAVYVANYMADFYKAEADRAESYNGTINSLAYGTEYILNVYPQTPLGTFCAPLSAEIKTEPEVISESAVRFEFEDYFPVTSLIKKSELASGGKIVSSNQAGAYLNNNSTLSRDEENPTYSVTFNANLPYDGDYTVRYASSFHTNSEFVSYMDFYIDDTLIGTNDNSYEMDLSQGNTYPWQYTPLMRYKKEITGITAGTHTIKVDIHLPTTTVQKQPFLFCMDYIEFEPKALIAGPGKVAKAEFEDYISDVSFEQTDGTVYKPKKVESAGASGGAYAFFDSTDGISAAEFVDIEIPLSVDENGTYGVEYVINNGTGMPKIYLDDKANGAINTDIISTTIDSKVGEKFPIFDSTWASAQRVNFNAELTAGSHTLIVEIPWRASFKDIALYLDYIKFTNDTVVVDPDQTTTIAFSDYIDEFSPKATVWEHEAAESGVLAYAGGGAETTLKIPFVAKKGDLYSFKHTGAYASNLSDIYVYIDSTDSKPICVINAENENFNDLSANGEVYQSKNNWLKKEYTFKASVSAGLHDLIYVIKDRGNDTGVAYALDNLKITKHVAEIDSKNAARIELEDYVQKIAIPMSDGSTYKAKVSTSASCSNGAYLLIDTPDNQAVDTYYSFEIPVSIKSSAVYRVSYVANKGTSPADIYLNGVDGTFLLSDSKSNVTLINNTKDESGLYPYFESSWAHTELYEAEMYIPAGEHKLTIRLKQRTNLDFARYFDYIEFAPTETHPVAADAATRFEYEDFGTVGIVTDLPYASGNAVMHQDWGGVPINLYIPITVEKSGMYDLTYVVSDPTVTVDGEKNKNDGYLSDIEITVDDTFVGNNRGGSIENLGSVYEIWQTAPVCKYAKQVYLEAGDHMLLTSVKLTKDARYKYTIDYMELSPAQGISENETEVTATAMYENAVSGEAVLALYNGNKLVSVGKAIVEDSNIVSVSAPKVEYTTAKLMVWSTLGDLKPVATAKTYQK